MLGGVNRFSCQRSVLFVRISSAHTNDRFVMAAAGHKHAIGLPTWLYLSF